MSDDKQAKAENELLGNEPVVKTAKQLEKEAAKAAKLAKLQQKQAAQAAQQSAAPKEKAEVNCTKLWLFSTCPKIFFFCRKKRKLL